MKVLMIPFFLDNPNLKNESNFLVDQYLALQKRGAEVTVVFPDVYSAKHLKEYLNYKNTSGEIYGISAYRDRALAPFKHKIRGCETEFVKACERIINRQVPGGFDFDIIHAHNCIWGGSAARALGEKYGVPYVITEHSSQFGLVRHELTPEIEKHIKENYSGAAHVMCVSAGLKRDMADMFAEPEILGNIVRTDEYLPGRMSESGTYNFISVAYINNGTRARLKGIDILCRAMKILLDRGVDAKLRIIGIAEGTAEVDEMVQSSGCEEAIEIIKPLTRAGICDYMHQSHCFVLPSIYETFGLVYAEAMAAGLPVISTDVGIAGDIVTPETGIIIRERTPEALADAMEQMTMKRDIMAPEKMHAMIEGKYSEEKIAGRLLEIYAKATGK